MNKKIPYYSHICLVALLSLFVIKIYPNTNSLENPNLNWMYVDFDVSIAKGILSKNYENFENRLIKYGNTCNPLIPNSLTNLDIFSLAKEIYKKNNLSVIKKRRNKKIPKIIHHIWLGGQLPEKYEVCIHSWKKHHPDWQFK